MVQLYLQGLEKVHSELQSSTPRLSSISSLSAELMELNGYLREDGYQTFLLVASLKEDADFLVRKVRESRQNMEAKLCQKEMIRENIVERTKVVREKKILEKRKKLEEEYGRSFESVYEKLLEKEVSLEKTVTELLEKELSLPELIEKREQLEKASKVETVEHKFLFWTQTSTHTTFGSELKFVDILIDEQAKTLESYDTVVKSIENVFAGAVNASILSASGSPEVQEDGPALQTRLIAARTAILRDVIQLINGLPSHARVRKEMEEGEYGDFWKNALERYSGK